jgi:hypothetical protein
MEGGFDTRWWVILWTWGGVMRGGSVLVLMLVLVLGGFRKFWISRRGGGGA